MKLIVILLQFSGWVFFYQFDLFSCFCHKSSKTKLFLLFFAYSKLFVYFILIYILKQKVYFIIHYFFIGRKSGLGCYVYVKGSKDKDTNQDLLTLLKKYELVSKGANSDEDLQMRLVSRFVNEAILCLQEGILDNPVSIVFSFNMKLNKSLLEYRLSTQ